MWGISAIRPKLALPRSMRYVGDVVFCRGGVIYSPAASDMHFVRDMRSARDMSFGRDMRYARFIYV